MPRTRQASDLFQEIANFPLSSSKNTFLYILESLSELVDASNAIAYISQRAALETSWRLTHVIPINYTNTQHAQHMAMLKDYAEQDNRATSEAHASLMGTHRTYLSTDFSAPPASPDDIDKNYYHLLHVLHVHEGLEIYLCLGRVAPPSFTTHELALVEPLTRGLLPYIVRYCMVLGLMPGQEATTPREQETLQHLLCGLSEKEIGVAMGLTHRSAHQYVTTIYRKLQVNSRAQLMALWLNPPGCESV